MELTKQEAEVIKIALAEFKGRVLSLSTQRSQYGKHLPAVDSALEKIKEGNFSVTR